MTRLHRNVPDQVALLIGVCSGSWAGFRSRIFTVDDHAAIRWRGRLWRSQEIFRSAGTGITPPRSQSNIELTHREFAQTASSPSTRRQASVAFSFSATPSFGLRSRSSNSFAWYLEAMLLSAGFNCEVLNLSVSGFGTAEMLIALEKSGLNYSPDLVIFQWH